MGLSPFLETIQLARKRDIIDRSRPCKICAGIFTPALGGKTADQQTCGRACGVELRRQKRVVRSCASCGKQFEATGLGNARFCSVSCRPKPEPPEPLVRSCSECAGGFTGIGKTCSLSCAHEAKLRYDHEYNQRRRASGWDRSPRTCPQCETSYAPTYVGQAYCGSKCAKRASRKRERQAGSRSNNDFHRHRARKYGRRYVPIRPLDIFDRDRWVCQICKKRAPKGKAAPHPLSPSLDHIIPMSCEGGDHVPENVQLAHFRCNSVKGAKIDTVQLKLIG